MMWPAQAWADRRWAMTYGGSQFDYSRDVATDASGNVYVVGYTSSTNFPKTQSSGVGGGYDAYLLKLDSLGNRVWAITMGGSGNDFAYGVAIDGQGNVYLTGKAAAGFPFTGTTFQGAGDDAFVAKVNSAGSVQWAIPYGGPGTDYGNSLGVDANGNVYVTGVAAVSGFPTTNATYAGNNDDAFLLKLDGSGQRQFCLIYGGASFDFGNDLVVLADGSSFLVGETGSGNFPNTSSAYAGTSGTKAFIAGFNANGTRQFAMKYGGSVVERALSCAWDASANQLVVVGYTESPDFPTNRVLRPGALQDIFVLRLHSNGQRNWAGKLGGANADYARGVAIDQAGHIFLTGESGSSDYPSTMSAFASQGSDAIITKLDSTGKLIWSGRYGGGQTDIGEAVAMRGPEVMFVGHSQSSAFPSTLNTYAGSGTEAFILDFTDCLGIVPQFSVANACIVDSVQFLGTSLAGTSIIASQSWDFGDGDNSTALNPIHLYASAGTYTLELRIVDGCGTPDSVAGSVDLYPKPVAAYTYTDTCATGNMNASSTSSVAMTLGSQVNAWQWYVDGIAADSLPSTTLANGQSRIVDLKLIVTTNFGCKDSTQRQIFIAPLPIVRAHVESLCYPNALVWTDSSTVDTGSIAALAWHAVADSLIGTGPSFQWATNDTGYFETVHVVITAAGCSDSLLTGAQVWPKPTAHFSLEDVCHPHPVSIQDSAVGNGGALVGWEYAFGDGQTSVLASPSHTYAGPGAYFVQQIVVTDHACRDTVADSVQVFPKPVAEFAADTVCLGDQTTFQNLSQVSSGSLVVHAWSFGDADSSSVIDPTHTYSGAGGFTVALAVETDHGCQDTIEQGVWIHALPVITFTYQQGTPDLCIGDSSLLAVATMFEGYEWEVGDTTAGIWVFAEDQYVVTVTDSNGCQSTDSSFVEFHAVPSPNPSIWPLDSMWACPLDSTFLDAGPGYATYFWNTGDTTRWLAQPAPGDYAVTVTNGFGCQGVSSSVHLEYFAPTAAPMILQQGDSLMATSGTAWQWYLDGQPIGPATQQVWHPLNSGSYVVEVTDSNGCLQASAPFTTVVGTAPTVQLQLRAWPNPLSASGDLHISGWQGLASAEIMDSFGRIVWAKSGLQSEQALTLQGIASGFYTLTVHTRTSSGTVKFILR
ncbi:MAG: PKD domain-containing protein [Bacteroidia bacterium]